MLSKVALSTYLLGSVAAFALPEAHINDLVARQTSGSTCTLGPDASSIFAGKPTVPADLASAAATFVATVTNLCDQPNFTGSISEEWVSYTSASQSWSSANSAALASVLSSFESACPESSSALAAVSSAISGVAAQCSTATSAAVTSAAAGSSSNAAAPMQTVMAAGVAVVAGAIGILAM